MRYIKRTAEKTVQRYLSVFPVVGVTGPRQSGKSTLLLHLLKDYTYVSFDDLRNIDYFENDPDGFIQQYSDRVIFDKVQYVPKLFNHIKIAVDRDRENYGKFVLTGSSQFAFLQNVSESLAGRIGLLTLLPFQFTEIPIPLVEDSVFKGSYPELVNRKYKESELWYSAYFDTYLNKDIRTLSNIGDMRNFRRFISLLAAQTATILKMSEYAKELGISVPTVKRWLSILEASYIIFLLPAFYQNYGKRIIKSPKIYFYDAGMVSYLTGVSTRDLYDKGPMSGSIFENYVISEILKKEVHVKSDAVLFYLRTSDKTEIDLIIDRKVRKELIEIKKTSTFKSAMISTLKKFKSGEDDAYLLYNGGRFPYHDNIRIMNYQDYLSADISSLSS